MTHPVLARLASDDPEERRAACRDAAEDPAGVLFAEALAEALGDPSKPVARAASHALVAVARRAGGGVEEAVRGALHGRCPERRWGAALTLARLEPPSPRLLPPLVEALGAADGDVRWAAARVVVDVGRLHGEVLPLLVGLVREAEPPVVRRMAAYALRELAPDRPEAADALVDAARDADLHVRRAALTAMASLLAPPPHVGRCLLETLRADADAAARRLAALALGEIGAADPEAVPPETARQLHEVQAADGDPDLQRAAGRALARLASGVAA